MEILVTSPHSVIVDGVNFGAVADAIANNKQLASGIQIALQKYDEEQKALLDSVKTELAGNQAYQKEAIKRAKKVIASGNFAALESVLSFAEADFKEKERQKALEEIQKQEKELNKRKQELGL
jgi:DNA replication protein DnaC